MDQRKESDNESPSQASDSGYDHDVHAPLGPPEPRPVPVTEIKGPEARETDEPGSMQTAENPTLVREEVVNTSTSSGTHAGDEGDDQFRKELLRRGHREVSRLD